MSLLLQGTHVWFPAPLSDSSQLSTSVPGESDVSGPLGHLHAQAHILMHVMSFLKREESDLPAWETGGEVR